MPGVGNYNLAEDLSKKGGKTIPKADRKPLTDYQETGDKGPGTYHNNYTSKKFPL